MDYLYNWWLSAISAWVDNKDAIKAQIINMHVNIMNASKVLDDTIKNLQESCNNRLQYAGIL